MKNKWFHPPTGEQRMKQKPDQEALITPISVFFFFFFFFFLFFLISFLSFSGEGKAKFSSDFAWKKS